MDSFVTFVRLYWMIIKRITHDYHFWAINLKQLVK